jgi:hypothetical protein
MLFGTVQARRAPEDAPMVFTGALSAEGTR